MRFFGLCASALAAVALAQAPAGYDQSTTTSIAKATMTRTVLRVVETVTATRNGTLSAYESTTTETTLLPTSYYASGTGHLPGYGNSTTLGTGAHPSVSKTGSAGAPMQTHNAAGKFGVEAMGLAAVAGLVGLAVF